MPKVGEIKRGKEINRKGTGRYIWIACEDCGKERWVVLRNWRADSMRCRSCAMKISRYKPRGGKEHPMWNGGRIITSGGYVRVHYPNHPDAVNNYVLEHRLVLEQKLGRPLKSTEVGHHLNGIKADNRPENLVAVPRGCHIHLAEPFKERIKQLEAQVEELQAQLK